MQSTQIDMVRLIRESADLLLAIIEDVLGALGVEVHGYMRLDREHDGVTRTVPKRGSTAERLLVLYVIIENHMV